MKSYRGIVERKENAGSYCASLIVVMILKWKVTSLKN